MVRTLGRLLLTELAVLSGRCPTLLEGSKRLAGVGHSMGGMLLACLAAGAGEYSSDEPRQGGEERDQGEGTGHEGREETEHGGHHSEQSQAKGDDGGASSARDEHGHGGASGSKVPVAWEMARVVTIASCLECSIRSGPGAPESSYAQLAALAGAVPNYLYSGRGSHHQRARPGRGVNQQCTSRCSLAKFRVLIIMGKYDAVIGW